MELRTIIISIESINNKLERVAENKSKEKRRKTLEDELLAATMVEILQASPSFLSKIAFSPPSCSSPASSPAVSELPLLFSSSLFIDLGLKGVFLGWNDEILDLGSQISPRRDIFLEKLIDCSVSRRRRDFPRFSRVFVWERFWPAARFRTAELANSVFIKIVALSLSFP